MAHPLLIDGAQGEGGGQILRTTLALSAVTGVPVVVDNIRAGRKKPGLLRQHLTAARALREITGAAGSGMQLGSTTLTFAPGPARAGEYRFAVGSAGSAGLVFQTVLWPLLFANGASRVVFEGGTHNDMAPPYPFLEQVFLPQLYKMGARVTLRLERYGFYPAGGGRFVADIAPCQTLKPLTLLQRGPLLRRTATALCAELPARIGERELIVVRRDLGWRKNECQRRQVENSRGPGNVLMLRLEYQHCCEIVTGFGRRGTRAEQVAAAACREAERYIDSDAPVSSHLADQLIVPLALAGAGAFRTMALSPHTQTNIEVVAQLLGKRAAVVDDGPGVVRVVLAPGPN